MRHFACDDLLPPGLAREIHAAFPGPADMRFSDDLRERKYAGRDTSRFQPLINEVLFAFQDPGVLALVSEITGIQSLEADPSLYASGVSMMAQGHFW